jgi:acetolactate synthase-1/3 small subunit
VERELMMIRVQADSTRRVEVLRIADIFHCKVVDVSLSELTLEVTGDQEKLATVTNLLHPCGIRESVRTGPLILRRLHAAG